MKSAPLQDAAHTARSLLAGHITAMFARCRFSLAGARSPGYLCRDAGSNDSITTPETSRAELPFGQGPRESSKQRFHPPPPSRRTLKEGFRGFEQTRCYIRPTQNSIPLSVMYASTPESQTKHSTTQVSTRQRQSDPPARGRIPTATAPSP